ncbi:hypothetical protein BO78DRAFT_381357, partial [Aspergillus sclerotiicarbonarius CBS 121057]
CRQRKVKCNEARPVCGPCAKSSRDCVFADCVFRHYTVEDLDGDAEDRLQTWVKVPLDLVFVQITDPFADEEPTYLLDDHPPIASPSIPAVDEDVVPSSTRSTAPPEENGILIAVLLQHYKECPSQ